MKISHHVRFDRYMNTYRDREEYRALEYAEFLATLIEKGEPWTALKQVVNLHAHGGIMINFLIDCWEEGSELARILRKDQTPRSSRE